MSKDKSSLSMYNELLERANDHESHKSQNITNPSGLGKYFEAGDEDSEEFMTSTEIVKTKETMEKRLGISPSDEDGIIEESVHFQRFTKRREHKYTEKEMTEIRFSCHRTIVHDYGEYDIYHVSNEERARNDQLSEISMKLGKLKRTYRRVDQYIDAMRVVFQAWGLLEKVNFIHTKEEFYKMVATGEIISNRIIMPKLKRMDHYNIDMIINYISNPELDASHLVPKKVERDHDSFFDDDYDNEETEDEVMQRMISREDAKYIFDKMDSPEKLEIGYIKSKYIKGYDRRTLKKKKNKKGNKQDQNIRTSISEMLNKIQNGSHYKDSGASYMVTNSLFEPEKREKSMWDDLKFNGSWGSNSNVALYDLVVNEEMLKEHPIKEKYLTYADKELQKFFTILEDNGVNAIDLRRKIDVPSDGNSKKKELATKKENKKLENTIIQRIAKLNKSDKFKKIVNKAEDALSKYREGE